MRHRYLDMAPKQTFAIHLIVLFTGLQEFLIDIQASQGADLNSLAAILCQRSKGSQGPGREGEDGALRKPPAEGDDLIRLICMRWLHQIVSQAKPRLKERYADILAAVLPQLAQANPDVVLVRLFPRSPHVCVCVCVFVVIH